MVGVEIIAGIGCRRGATLAALAAALDAALAATGRQRRDLIALASWTVKGDEPGLLALAQTLDLPLALYDSKTLALQPVSTGSDRVQSLTGLPSIAEAAARTRAGANARTILARHVEGGVVVALVDAGVAKTQVSMMEFTP